MKTILKCGDCLDVMKDIPDASIDLVMADLPYGTTQNRWDSIIPLDDLWDRIQPDRKARWGCCPHCCSTLHFRSRDE